MGGGQRNAPAGGQTGAGLRNHEGAIAAEALNVAAVVTNASHETMALETGCGTTSTTDREGGR